MSWGTATMPFGNSHNLQRNRETIMFHADRRKWLTSTAAGLAAGLATGNSMSSPIAAQEPAAAPQRKGRIRQSVMGWCFKPMPALDLARLGKSMGLVAIEGVDASSYPEVKQIGLEISLVGSHGFGTGPVDTANHPAVEAALRKSIDTAVKFGSPNVITFTGMRLPGMRDEVAKQNCLDCWKRVIEYAEEKQITLCLEHLNSRDNTHPMKGHPGYFGDDVDLCVELIQKMDSPSFRLLFDIYHVQIMHGDVIRRIRNLHPWIAHYHTAGNPGRCEIDEQQEINYPPILAAILETGYQGYVAHEFIPTWDDPARALQHAVDLSDI